MAEFRQSWTDKVIDALSDYHAILMSIDDGHSLSPDDRRNLTALWTRLELLLNPDEADAVSLLRLADAARLSKSAFGCEDSAAEPFYSSLRLIGKAANFLPLRESGQL